MTKRMHREVRFGSYVLGSTLGEGEFGKVKLGWRKDGNFPSQVAIKLIKRESIQKDSDSEIKIHREINSLKLLNHPNIVNLVEVMKSGKYIGIVLEYASGGELFDYILQHKFLKENVAKKLFAQLVSGVDHMHAKGLVHRDLKLENLLLDKHKNVIISDFGFVNSYNRDKSDYMKTSCGSPCYAAPELVLTQSPYEGRKVDIWSLGVILYAMLSGYLPFDDDPENEDGADIVKLYHYICRTPLTFPEYVSPLARDLLRKIIVPDPKKRITLNEIREHQWLAPYKNLLAIRQPDWDKMHRDRKIAAASAASGNHPNTAANASNRFSMVNERTNSYLMNAQGGRGRSASTISNNGHIYANPPVATTSSSLTTAVGQTEKTPSPTKQFPVNAYRTHAKSASVSNPYYTASSALMAVVSESEKRNSVTLLEQVYLKPTAHVPPAHKSKTQLPAPIARSTTYTGTPISTIVESPTRLTFDRPAFEYVEPQQALEQPFTHMSAHNRLPQTKKPRPTSYHPSSLSSSMGSGNSSSALLFDYFKIPTGVNLPYPNNVSPTRGSPTSDTSLTFTNENVLLGSPVSKDRSSASLDSRRNSVVTHVHVNGVLTSEMNSHENKRNSVLSYLEDKIDGLDLDMDERAEQEDTTITPQINQAPVFDSQVVSPVQPENEGTMTTPLDSKQPQQSETSEAPDKQDRKVEETSHPDSLVESEVYPEEREPIVFIEDHYGPKEKSSEAIQIVKERSRETGDSDVFLVKPERKTKGHNRGKSVDTQSIASKREKRRDQVHQENKENQDEKTHNRQSLHPVYHHHHTPSTSVHHIPPPSTNRRALEPTSDNHSNDTSLSKGSTMKRPPASSGSTSTTSTGSAREASAARKVMDFFKRRSVRIN